MEDMFSIKEILQSEKFQRDAPEKLKLLIDRASPKAAMSSANKAEREDRQPNQTITKSKKKNAA